jgi:hypothetical protein
MGIDRALVVDDRFFSTNGESMWSATSDDEVSLDVIGVSADDPNTSWDGFHRSGVGRWPFLRWTRFLDPYGLEVRCPTDR